MSKIKSLGLAGIATLTVAALALNGSNVQAAGSCAATTEEELYAALADSTCGGVITLNKSPIQDKGIQLTKDFDGQGATLQLGTSSYGLLIDDHGLDGHAGVVAGDSIVIRNVTIKAAAATKALINIDDIPTTLENVITDRTATDSANYFAHINVKDTTGLTFTNYDAAGGFSVLDYSSSIPDEVLLDFDSASIAGLTDVQVFILAYGDNDVISAGNSATLDFLMSDTTVFAKDDVQLNGADKQELLITTPVITSDVSDSAITLTITDAFAIKSLALTIDGAPSDACDSVAFSNNMTCILDISGLLTEDHVIELTVGNGVKTASWGYTIQGKAPAPSVSGGSTEDGRDVVVVADGASDAAVVSIADSNDNFASFLSQVGDDAVFLALDDRGDCDGSGCQVSLTVSNLESHTTYYLYHYDADGNVELVGEYLSDANGDVAVSLEKFSGNVLSKAKIELASANGTKVLAPSTGAMSLWGSANANSSLGGVMALGSFVSVVSFSIFKFTHRRTRR